MARELTSYDRARGLKLKEIREAMELSQSAIVERLNDAARRLNLPDRYVYYTVSRMEKGSISFEDARVWLSVAADRDRFTWEWFVGGPLLGSTVKPKASTPRLIETTEVETIDPQAGRRGSAAPRRVVGRRPPGK